MEPSGMKRSTARTEPNDDWLLRVDGGGGPRDEPYTLRIRGLVEVPRATIELQRLARAVLRGVAAAADQQRVPAVVAAGRAPHLAVGETVILLTPPIYPC